MNESPTEQVIESLRQFEAFDGLSEDDLTVLATRASVRELRPRTVLFRHGDNDSWIYCLAEGALDLTAKDGRARRIEAGSHAASYPIASLRPRQYTATTLTRVQVISINGDDIGNWHEVLFNRTFEVEELAELEVVEEQAGSLDECERLLGATIELPNLPAVALQAQRVIDRDDSGAALLARLVLNDPSITAKLIKAANSPVFYGRGNIETCERAIVRLGLKTTRQLVIAFAMRDLFKCESAQLHERMNALWEHSAEVAAIAFVLARSFKVCDPDEAQLAGLVHDIGGVPVLSHASSNADLRDDAQALSALDERLRPELGPHLLRSWNFPEPIAAAAHDAEHWHRNDPGAPDLSDLLIVAHLVSHLGKPQAIGMPPLRKVPAFIKLFGDDAGPEQIFELLDEAQTVIDDLQSLLRS